ncbi:hypothetical protein JCM10207_008594 [Rhodosporidiobolus poonsookiae]
MAPPTQLAPSPYPPLIYHLADPSKRSNVSSAVVGMDGASVLYYHTNKQQIFGGWTAFVRRSNQGGAQVCSISRPWGKEAFDITFPSTGSVRCSKKSACSSTFTFSSMLQPRSFAWETVGSWKGREGMVLYDCAELSLPNAQRRVLAQLSKGEYAAVLDGTLFVHATEILAANRRRGIWGELADVVFG